MENNPLKIKLVLHDAEFVRPYIERELADCEFVEDGQAADREVHVSQHRDDLAGASDAALRLFCPNIVATGMTGVPMQLARAIAGGRIYHIKGNEARISVVHTTDVARAVALALHTDGLFTVTDGREHTIDELMEALASRLDDRRIYTLPMRWARWLMPRSLVELTTTDSIFDGSDFASRDRKSVV